MVMEAKRQLHCFTTRSTRPLLKLKVEESLLGTLSGLLKSMGFTWLKTLF